MSNREVATDILRLIGGKENINSVVHCATRLRFKLKDESLAQTEEIKAHTGVIQVVQNGGQYQIVIGSHVNDVYNELIAISGLVNAPKDESETDAPKEKQSPLNVFIDVISSIFTPFLGVLAGTGVLRALLNLLVVLGWISADSGVYTVLFAAADGFLMYLPFLLAITAARKFKVNEYIAAAIAMALLHTGVGEYNAALEAVDSSFTFLGIPVIYGAGYRNTVFPIIIAVYLQSFVEPFVKKVTPPVLRTIGIAMFTLIIMVPLTFVIIGPAGTLIGVILGGIFQTLYAASPLIAGLVLGGAWQIMVMFGMHWGLVPVAIGNLIGSGYDVLLPLVIPGVISQGGAALAVAIKSKNRKTKGLASSGTITAIFGITEPTIYGVNLPLKKPFIAGCIGGAIGGMINGFAGVRIFAFTTSIFSIPAFIGPGSNPIAAISAIVIAFTTAFVLTLVFGFEDKK